MNGDDRAALRIGAMDRAIGAFGAVAPISLHVVVDLDTRLDPVRLEDAWQMLGRRLPILRAWTDLSHRREHWSVDAELGAVVVVEDGDEAPELSPGPVEAAVLRAELDLAAGAATRLMLVGRGPRHRLVLTTSHALIDGWSAGEVLAGLATLYRTRSVDRLAVAADARPRRIEDVLEVSGLSATNRALVAGRYARRWFSPARSAHPVPHSTSPAPGYAGADVTEALRALRPEQRRQGWRTTAVLLALLARAWATVFDDEASRGGSRGQDASGWQLTSDLRRELGVPGGLGNLSGTEPVLLRGVHGRPLSTVIADAHRAIGGLASTWPGLGAALAAMAADALPAAVLERATAVTLERVASLGYGRSLSNVGVWPTTVEDWGDATLQRALFVPSLPDPRWPTIVLLGAAGRTWLTMRTHTHGVSVDDVTHLGEAMVTDARSAG